MRFITALRNDTIKTQRRRLYSLCFTLLPELAAVVKMGKKTKKPGKGKEKIEKKTAKAEEKESSQRVQEALSRGWYRCYFGIILYFHKFIYLFIFLSRMIKLCLCVFKAEWWKLFDYSVWNLRYLLFVSLEVLVLYWVGVENLSPRRELEFS